MLQFNYKLSEETEASITADFNELSFLYCVQESLPVIEAPIEDFKELGTVSFKADADPTASAASTIDSALPTVFSPTETADSAADSTAEAAFEAAFRAAPINPPPIEERPDIFE